MRSDMVVYFGTVADMLAKEDDYTQATFFDSFVRALKVECDPSDLAEVQISAMKRRMQSDTLKMLWPDEEM